MTRNLYPTVAVLLTATFATCANAGPVDCARPAIGTGETQACRAAALGVAELRQYIQRTQGIHILYIQDFAAAVRPT